MADVATVKGVGPKTAENLHRAGVKTVGDLLYCLPRLYENYQTTTNIEDLRPGNVVVKGKISNMHIIRTGRRKLTLTQGTISDATGSIRTVWFNQPYRAKQFDEAREYYFTGKYELKNGRYQLLSPSAALVQDVENNANADFRPIYSAKSVIKPALFQKLLENLRPQFAEIPDLLPASEGAPKFVKKGARADALYNCHFPEKPEDAEKGRQYLAYEELFELILAAKLNKQENQRLKSISLPFEAKFTKNLVENLPFPLTNAQRKATWEILQDLERGVPMNRLLQGDVGSGKTIVAALAAAQTAQNGYQIALLAPTAILATQHYESLKRLFKDLETALKAKFAKNAPAKTEEKSVKSSEMPLNASRSGFAVKEPSDKASAKKASSRPLNAPEGQKTAMSGPNGSKNSQNNGKIGKISSQASPNPAQSPEQTARKAFRLPKIALLTGATKNKYRLKRQIANGEIDFVIGTHALLTDDTNFQSLAFCIIDEQHRFGVNQRQKLLLKSQKGFAPHLLSMTATPIPRSLQLTVFGDLDVSVLNELPPGRQPILTKILPETEQVDELYPAMRALLAKKQQIYWICQLIEEKNTNSATPVKKQLKKLQELFPDVAVGMLHGKMKPDEKDQIMEEFSSGKIQILVSTTVVEVGVNVPNANMIVIQDAENYGLAQLHQLRGRVGRGDQPASCFLLTTGETKPSRRLREMEKSTDGFHLAEVDLKIRGPGEIYGAMQHGELNLQVASLTDTELIAQAGHHAGEFAKDPSRLDQYKELKDRIAKYQQLTTLN